MNDADIIKALECCFVNENCTNCPCYENRFSVYACETEIPKQALDLIKRQQAEIERLKDYNENLLSANTAMSCNLLDEVAKARVEAIKEFAERLKEEALYPYPDSETKIVDVDDIDNLVKEMTEG